jgi:CRP-like cAMP-binding protein
MGEVEPEQLLGEAGKRPEFVYFPDTAVLSVVRDLGAGERMEVASIGHEGMNALPLFFGAEYLTSDSQVLTGGTVARMPLADFMSAAAEHGSLNAALRAYADFLFADMERAVVCGRFHTVPQQLARWLLGNSDRVGRDDFFVTHDFVANLFGVRRATISEAVEALRRAGILGTGRARIIIVDRERLRTVSCSCYMRLPEGSV